MHLYYTLSVQVEDQQGSVWWLSISWKSHWNKIKYLIDICCIYVGYEVTVIICFLVISHLCLFLSFKIPHFSAAANTRYLAKRPVISFIITVCVLLWAFIWAVNCTQICPYNKCGVKILSRETLWYHSGLVWDFFVKIAIAGDRYSFSIHVLVEHHFL